MAEHPYMPLWTDAYLADTTDLSAEEHGVYLLLLMAAWRTPGCALPDDDNRLARMARVGLKKWRKLRPVMERFFTVEDGLWTQKRLLREREWVENDRAQKRKAGKASAQKRQQESKNSFPCASNSKKFLASDSGQCVTDNSLENPQSGSAAVATEQPAPSQHPHPHPEKKERPPNGGQKKAQGSRLPDDWWPDDTDVAAAQREGLNDADIEREAAKFRDYWVGVPGQRGRKADWRATWRNWVRKAAEGRQRSPPRNAPQGRGRSSASVVDVTADLVSGRGVG